MKVMTVTSRTTATAWSTLRIMNMTNVPPFRAIPQGRRRARRPGG
jgi:hypothetical protein